MRSFRWKQDVGPRLALRMLTLFNGIPDEQNKLNTFVYFLNELGYDFSSM